MKRAQRSGSLAGGFSIIEFMIAITISLIILAALTGAFVSSSRARDEMDRANQQIESGRYAMQVISDDLEMAGFWDRYDVFNSQQPPPVQPSPSGLSWPTASAPDPCSLSLADFRLNLPLSIQGYDSPAANPLSCITDVKPFTDILVVRRLAMCTVGTAGCTAPPAGTPLFQASSCNSGAELQSGSWQSFFRLDTNTGALDRNLRDCTTRASYRQYVTHIYFIANNDQSGDKIPTLKRAELGMTAGALAFTVTALAEGIGNMQLEYGIDTDALGAAGYGIPDAYTADPNSYAAAGGNCPATASDCTNNWINTMAVRVNLLARNPTTTPNYVDSKFYTLGFKSDGSPNFVPGPTPSDAFNDGYKRHVYTATVRLNNPARRRDT